MSIELQYRYNAQDAWKPVTGPIPNPPPSTSTPPSPSPPAPVTSDMYDDFNGKSWKLTDGQKSPDGKWFCLFAGGGAAEIKSESATDQYLYLSPAAVGSGSGTRGANLLTTKMYKDFELTLDVKTIKQLRTVNPNNWETAWINWTRAGSIDNLVENRFHAYAFTLKMDGWQLEKKDNERQDDTAEIYLATGSNPDVILNKWQKHRIRVTGTATGTPRIEVWIDGQQICNYVDNRIPNSEKMKREGPIVLYTEDAAVAFDDVIIKPL